MAKPRLFFGARSGGLLVEAGIGFDDAGAAYSFRAKTSKLAPAGAGGECIFTSLYLSVVHFAPVAFRVTPIVDEVAEITQEVTLAGLSPLGGPFTEAQRLVEPIEVGLSRPYLVGGVERLRTYPRGIWFEVLVEATASTFFRIDAVEVEHQIVVSPARPVGVAV
ncbi:MAG: hypothetical protein ACRDQZ_13055 [Mycobacteriales bacterium]